MLVACSGILILAIRKGIKVGLENFLGGFTRYLREELYVKKNTIVAYRQDLQKFFAYLSTSVDPVGPSIISSFMRFEREQGLSLPTLARRLSTLKAFFRYLCLQGIYESDPTQMFHSPQTLNNDLVILAKVEMQRLLSQPNETKPNDARNLALMRLLYSTGSRISETLSLSLKDLEPGCYRVRFSPKTKRDRRLILDETTQNALKLYLKEFRPVLIRDNRMKKIFVSRNGKPLGRDSVWYIIKKYARQAGISKRISPDTLRHTAAVHQLQKDIPLPELQYRMGILQIISLEKYLNYIAFFS